MHFVKKVPTSDEEKAAKEKERSVKLKLFCAARDRIFQKRANGELDEEMLQLTQKLLEKNPDIYSFWTIRRDVIQNATRANEECIETTEEEECKTKCRKAIEEFYVNELYLTQKCLEANPKSYSAWFHRGWALKRQAAPNIDFELKMIEKGLKMDCRNFHCWDHRRVVCKIASLSEEEELEFSNKLIGENFSNYSAWHYRATLLPKIHGDVDRIDVSDELKKVTSACFMDPEDQSAWVYCRWLIEMGSFKEFSYYSFISVSSRLSQVPVPISVSFHGDNTTVVMSRACTVDQIFPFLDSSDEGEWKGVSSVSKTPSHARVWQFLSEKPLAARLEQEGEFHSVSQKPLVNKCQLHRFFDVIPRGTSVAIDTIVKNCKELMEEEGKNTWVVFTYTLCLMETAPIEKHDEIVTNLQKLANELDSKRKEVYRALESRQVLGKVLREKDESGQMLLDRLIAGTEKRLNLRYKEFVTLEGVELLAGLVTDVDATGNQLVDIEEILLPNMTHLTLNENPINRLCTNVPLNSLEFLSIASCPVESVDAVIEAAKEMPALQRLIYCETPLVAKTRELEQALPNIRHIPHWL